MRQRNTWRYSMRSWKNQSTKREFAAIWNLYNINQNHGSLTVVVVVVVVVVVMVFANCTCANITMHFYGPCKVYGTFESMGGLPHISMHFRNPLTLTYPGPLDPGPRFQELGTLLGHHGRDGATWGILGIVVIILTGRLQIWTSTGILISFSHAQLVLWRHMYAQ